LTSPEGGRNGSFLAEQARFAKIAAHLPNTRGKKRVDDRRVISGIVHVLKSGGRWADAPLDVYGPKKSAELKGVEEGRFALRTAICGVR
jgi:transposase